MGKKKKGVLLLADVVGYTSQARELAQEKVGQFLENYEKKIGEITGRYKADFIKRSGDAVLIFIEDEEESLGLIEELRKNSRDKVFDSCGIGGVLRIVAHLGKFAFKTSGEKPVDVIDTEAIKLFRIEKFAGSYEVVITSTLFDLLEENLKDKNITSRYLGTYELKGYTCPVILLKLIFPGKDTINPRNILSNQMKQLEGRIKKIPVFGDLYPSISMEKNFLNLHITLDHSLENTTGGGSGLEWYKEDTAHFDFQVRMVDTSRDSITVSDLYDRYRNGVILGLPGAGKTTILSYFAYRELKKNRHCTNNQNKRVVLFIECRNMINYEDCPSIYPHSGEDKSGPKIETILHYLTYIFLHGSKGKKELEVDKIDNFHLREASEIVIQAYNSGCLTLLIDALDESENTMIKSMVVDFLETLFIDSYEGETKESIKKGGNFIFLTSRYIERQNYFTREPADTFYPIIEVRPLDMEQLREMAGHFYGPSSVLYKEFDEVVWKEEIAAKIGGTPLTALLVLAYFKTFRQFDTRYAMYDLLITFMLIRAWEQIKRGDFKKDMNVFFKLAKEKIIFKESEYKEAGEVYEVLSFLSYNYSIGNFVSRHMKDTSIHSVFREFGKDSQTWIKRLEEDHVLVHAGPMEYVFIHLTVMDFLAARFLVNKLNDPGYLEKYGYKIDFQTIKDAFFESETLPIAVGSDIHTGSKLLELFKQHVESIKYETGLCLRYRTALMALVEYENLVVRRMKAAEIPFLIKQIENQVRENIGAIEWIYKYLKHMLLNSEKDQLKMSIDSFNNVSKLSKPFFLENYLTYNQIGSGDPGIVSLRKKLLYKLIDKNLVAEWFNRNEALQTDVSLKREKQQANTPAWNLLEFDSKIYNPEDKNFGYYRELVGNELKGFLGSPNLKHSRSVSCLLVVGRIIVSGSNDGTVKLWDMENGKEIHTFKGHYKGIVNLAVSGKIIISGSSDGVVMLWNIDSGEVVSSFKDGIHRLRCFAALDNIIISGTSDGTLRLLNANDGSEMLTYKGHEAEVTCIKTEGPFILSGGNDGTVTLWDMEKKAQIRHISVDMEGVGIRCITIAGNIICAGTSDGTIKLWDMNSGKNIRTIFAHTKAVHGIATSGNRIVSGGDTSIKLWNMENGEELYAVKGHPFWVTCIDVKGKTIVSGGGDTTIKLWDLESGIEIRNFMRHREAVNSIAVTENTLVSGASDTTIKVWDLSVGRDTSTLRGHRRGVSGVDAIGKMIVSGSMDGTIKLWDMDSSLEIRTLKGHNSWINSIALEDKTIISGGDDGVIKLWNRKSGKETHSINAHKGKVNCLAIAGKFLVSGSADGIVKVWNIEECKEVCCFKGHEKSVNCAAIEGNNIISGANDKLIKLWNMESREVIRTFEGHRMAVNSIAIKGKRIISASNDSTVRLWQIDTGECLKTIELPWIALDIKFFPGTGNRIATANANGTVTFFEL